MEREGNHKFIGVDQPTGKKCCLSERNLLINRNINSLTLVQHSVAPRLILRQKRKKLNVDHDIVVSFIREFLYEIYKADIIVDEARELVELLLALSDCILYPH